MSSVALPPLDKELKKWARQSPQTNSQIKLRKSRRIASVDCSDLSRRNCEDYESELSSERSLSSFSPPQVMQPLNFEKVEVKFTPLSSLRSCSEFNKQNSYNNAYYKMKKEQMNKKKSYFRNVFSWLSNSKKVKTSSLATDEQLFLVEQLRFRPDMEKDPSLNYRPRSKSNSSNTSTHKKSPKQSSNQRRDNKVISLMHESSLALDVVFGLNHGKNHISETYGNCMEIELKDLTGYRSSFYDDDKTSKNYRRETANEVIASSNQDIMVLSLQSNSMDIVNSPTIFEYVNKLKPIVSKCIYDSSAICKKYLLRDHNELFYDSLRIQPFASGAYLRGFLLSGFTSFFFNAYSLALWSDHNPTGIKLSILQKSVEILLYLLLCSQFFVNILQLPLRINIHYQCWESSRCVDVEGAVYLLRELVKSDVWVVSRGLGRLIDIMSIIFLILTEIYLWFTEANDPLRMLFVSMGATNLLAFIIRIFVALSFTVSMHDPQVLSEARRRGLSRWDLENLSTFVYTADEELNNNDCPICLNSFDMGDMLISLSCDKKHSFHASCIRQWLQRQNSCPLCQKLV